MSGHRVKVIASNNQALRPPGALTRILVRDGLSGSPWLQYPIAFALVGAALVARFAMLPANGGLAFNTFYPAIIAVSLLFGVGPGLVASALSAACADYFFLPPYHTFPPEGGYLSSLGFFFVTCALICYIAYGMRSAVTALCASEHKLRALYKTSNVGIVLTDMNRRYVDFNETFRRLTGYSADELRSLDYRTLTGAEDWAGTDEQLELAKRTGHFGPYEKEYIRKDGSRVPLRFNGALFTGEDDQDYLWSIVDDITDRRSIERALSNSISAEQQKIGRDLHDGLGQELAGISLLATAIASSIKKTGGPEAGELENLAKLASRSVANCRAIAHGLSPVALAEGGFVEVLKEMVTLQRDSFGIDARCDVSEGASLRLPADALDNLYRISQEAVANARRHGRAKAIQITLNIQPTTLRLDIEDDGIGLSKQTTQSTGMGIRIMQFRAANIGARLSIRSGEHGGTLVSVECPQPS